MLRGSGIETKWTFAGRFIDTKLERPRWRFTVNYRFTPRFQAGIEYNPVADEVGPLFTYYLNTESKTLPAIFAGTSSDRIGTPAGNQAYFITFAKQFGDLPLAPYASINYSEFDDKLNFPFGANVQLSEHWTLMPMYDGQRSHLLLNYVQPSYSVSLIYAWYERVGVAFSFGF